MRKTTYFIMALGIALGAFGAHGLKNIVSTEFLEIWKTAVFYQLIHGLGALFALNEKESKIAKIFLIGAVFFSGSLYALVLSGIRTFGAITPIGGVAFIIGWILLGVRVKESHE